MIVDVRECARVCVCDITCESCWFSHDAVLVVRGDDALAWTLRCCRHEQVI